MLRYLLIISFLIFTSSIEAQNLSDLSIEEQEYFELLNYTPINFVADSAGYLESNNPSYPFNSIWKLKNAFDEVKELNKIKILKKEIDQS